MVTTVRCSVKEFGEDPAPFVKHLKHTGGVRVVIITDAAGNVLTLMTVASTARTSRGLRRVHSSVEISSMARQPGWNNLTILSAKRSAVLIEYHLRCYGMQTTGWFVRENIPPVLPSTESGTQLHAIRAA